MLSARLFVGLTQAPPLIVLSEPTQLSLAFLSHLHRLPKTTTQNSGSILRRPGSFFSSSSLTLLLSYYQLPTPTHRPYPTTPPYIETNFHDLPDPHDLLLSESNHSSTRIPLTFSLYLSVHLSSKSALVSRIYVFPPSSTLPPERKGSTSQETATRRFLDRAGSDLAPTSLEPRLSFSLPPHEPPPLHTHPLTRWSGPTLL